MTGALYIDPEALAELSKVIDAEDSDLYDVLAYIAFAQAPISRAERVASHKPDVHAGHTAKEREFLDFVLDQYVRQGG